MKLNPDCIRDILFVVEELSAPTGYIRFNGANYFEQIKKYSDDEVMYHLKQCELSGLLYDVRKNVRGEFLVRDMSPTGHEFIANIRADSNWNKIKKTASDIGSNSLGAIMQIATAVISNIITTHFNK